VTVRLRPAAGGDVAVVARISHDAYAVYVERIGRRPAPVTADHAALVAAGEVTVATVAEAVVGVLVTRPAGSSLLLESAAVDPGHQGMGIGRALVAHAEALAAAAGLEAVELYTNQAMTENLLLYPRLGYVETARRSEDGYRRVYFRKPLAPSG
jgi:ribosomal protein S18 acetylase RimI-like enzyme